MTQIYLLQQSDNLSLKKKNIGNLNILVLYFLLKCLPGAVMPQWLHYIHTNTSFTHNVRWCSLYLKSSIVSKIVFNNKTNKNLKATDFGTHGDKLLHF